MERVVCLPARSPSRLCQLGGVPRHPRAAAQQRETTRRGRRRRPRGRRAAAGRRCAAGAAAGGCRSRIPATTAAASDTRACADFTCTAPRRRARPSAADDSTRRVAAAFLEAVTPAGVARQRRARSQSSTEQHEQRLAGQRLAVERAEYRSRARASGSSTRASRRTGSSPARWSASSRTALAEVEREQRNARRARARRPAAAHRRPSAKRSTRLARDLPRLWAATTTTDRDRKELLRTLISEIVIDRATAGERRRGRDLLGRRRAQRS